jgi:AcrR family transcriptional regulator
VAATTRLALRARARPRRTHAERTAETRAKIIAAVVDSIAAHGFQRTTAQEIATRAGVTWGAVQHHFGGKDGLLLAVLEESFNEFAEKMQDLPIGSTTLAERAGLFVDRAWAHFKGRHYRSTFEIMLNYLGRAQAGDGPDWRHQMLHALDTVWSRIFADSPLPRRRRLTLQHFTISALSGLASTLILAGPNAVLPKTELDLLKTLLASELAGTKA